MRLTRRIMGLDELSFEIRLERRTTKDSSSGRITVRLVPVFILESVLSIKTANKKEKISYLPAPLPLGCREQERETGKMKTWIQNQN